MALRAVGKYKGHENGSEHAEFAAFVVNNKTGEEDCFVATGSEDGSVFLWERNSSAVVGSEVETSETWESFLASEKPDKLTVVSPAPWNPEGSGCVVVGTWNGVVRVFYNILSS